MSLLLSFCLIDLSVFAVVGVTFFLKCFLGFSKHAMKIGVRPDCRPRTFLGDVERRPHVQQEYGASTLNHQDAAHHLNHGSSTISCVRHLPSIHPLSMPLTPVFSPHPSFALYFNVPVSSSYRPRGFCDFWNRKFYTCRAFFTS